jgi:hypothetical protein
VGFIGGIQEWCSFSNCLWSFLQEAAVVRHPLVQAVEDLNVMFEAEGTNWATDGSLKTILDAIVKECAGSSDARSVFGDANGLAVLGHIAWRIVNNEIVTPVLPAVFDTVRCVCTKHGVFRKFPW